MNAEKLVKSSQEQAVAAWINYLNQVRLDRLVSALSQLDINFSAAMETIEKTLSTIRVDIIERNRGGDKGMHGFIAEIAECGIGDARRQILGKEAIHQWVNDNGPVDFIRAGESIQQKFVQAGGHLSLKAVAEHLQKYPDYLAEGGKYQIPKDHYDKITYYLAMPESQANKLPTSTGEFSLRQWKEVHEFFSSGRIDITDLEGSIFEYCEVQKGTIEDAIDREKISIQQENRKVRDAAYQKSKPTVVEGAKATVVAAAAEGLTAFCGAIIRKKKTGKKLKDFTEDDWKEIAGDSGLGAVKGGIRGISVYALTNYTATPAAVASSLVTASFGVAQQAHMLRQGEIDAIQFIENSEMLCLDVSVSALASFAGQAIIPIPVLGAVVGNAVGMLLYQIGKDGLSAKEQEIISNYLKELGELDHKLAEEYQQCVDQLKHSFAMYVELLGNAFDADVEKALDGSVKLAKRMGVPTQELLKSHSEIEAFFCS